jgi:putative phage-type endonuclease
MTEADGARLVVPPPASEVPSAPLGASGAVRPTLLVRHPDVILSRPELLPIDPAVATVEAYSTEADWLAARRRGIGASEVAAVLGLVRSRSPVAVWLDKVGLDDAGRPAEVEVLRWGKRLQRPIADGYAEETGRTLLDPGPYTLLRSVRYPFLVASPDYLLRAPATRPEVGLLEVKNVSAYARADWADDAPLPYLLQVQAQLLVSGLAWAAITALLGGSALLYKDVPPHAGVMDWLVEDLAAFWRLVETETPPRPLDGAEATAKAIRRLYPTATPGALVTLPAAADEWDRVITDGEAELKRIGETVEAARNELRLAMGAAESGIVPGSSIVWSHKVERRKGYTREVPPWEGRVLRRGRAR